MPLSVWSIVTKGLGAGSAGEAPPGPLRVLKRRRYIQYPECMRNSGRVQTPVSCDGERGGLQARLDPGSQWLCLALYHYPPVSSYRVWLLGPGRETLQSHCSWPRIPSPWSLTCPSRRVGSLVGGSLGREMGQKSPPGGRAEQASVSCISSGSAEEHGEQPGARQPSEKPGDARTGRQSQGPLPRKWWGGAHRGTG